MAINFPNSPSDGDTHTFGGTTYTYNSSRDQWTGAGSGTGSGGGGGGGAIPWQDGEYAAAVSGFTFQPSPITGVSNSYGAVSGKVTLIGGGTNSNTMNTSNRGFTIVAGDNGTIVYTEFFGSAGRTCRFDTGFGWVEYSIREDSGTVKSFPPRLRVVDSNVNVPLDSSSSGVGGAIISKAFIPAGATATVDANGTGNSVRMEMIYVDL